MEILEVYLKSQTHKVISQDKKSGMLNHCYMITSKDTNYLKELARYLAKEIFCENENSPCDNCVSCNKINHSNMVDLIFYPKGEKSLVVDDINEIVTDCYIRPMSSKYKIYVLENFDECTVQAHNKILKTLEEPPANVMFILTCINEFQVLPTIASRSKKIHECPIDTSMLTQYLIDKDVKDYDLIANISQGNLTVACNLAENTSAKIVVELIFDILKNLNSSVDILKYSSKILGIKKELPFFLETFIAILRDVAVYDVSKNIIFKDKKIEYEILNKLYSKEMIARIVGKLSIINNKLDFNCNITGIIDQMLLDVLEVKFLCQK